LVFDPTAGQNGAWMYFNSKTAALGPLVFGSNIDSETLPMGVLRSVETPCIVRLDANDHAADTIWSTAALGSLAIGEDEEGFIVTDLDEEIIASEMAGDESFDTVYRTPWVTADWPTRKKSFRRPDFVCQLTGLEHDLQVRSYRDYEEMHPKRLHRLTVPSGAPANTGSPGTVAAVWNRFAWNDGTEWNQTGEAPTSEQKIGSSIRRGSSFGLCKALQLRISGLTPGRRWGIDAIVLKAVMRRFR
jgi:hypothetical protein